jgi:hypothetical protein
VAGHGQATAMRRPLRGILRTLLGAMCGMGVEMRRAMSRKRTSGVRVKTTLEEQLRVALGSTLAPAEQDALAQLGVWFDTIVAFAIELEEDGDGDLVSIRLQQYESMLGGRDADIAFDPLAELLVEARGVLRRRPALWSRCADLLAQTLAALQLQLRAPFVAAA